MIISRFIITTILLTIAFTAMILIPISCICFTFCLAPKCYKLFFTHY